MESGKVFPVVLVIIRCRNCHQYTPVVQGSIGYQQETCPACWYAAIRKGSG